MKKTKLLKSLVGLSALALPTMTVLTATGCSCSGTNYFKLAKKFKTTAIQEFINLSKCPRNTWLEGPVYDYIKERMDQLGYSPVAYDDFGSRPEVIKAAKMDIAAPVVYDENWNKYGNIWFDIPASEGCEKWPKVILHAHMDTNMVFKEGDQVTQIYSDWKQNGVDVYYDQDQQIMYSNGNKTSLGADCGVGCAELLAIATHARDEDFKHGPIRLLFTADESGAVNVTIDGKTYDYQSGATLLATDQETFEESKRPFDTNLIIDLDGYEQQDIMRSCAGIHECIYTNKQYEYQPIDWSDVTYTDPITHETTTRKKQQYKVTVTISRPQGASSGTDANKGYANALKILGDTIVEWDEAVPAGEPPIFQIIDVQSEGTAYSICPSANATYVSYLEPELLEKKIDEFTEMYENAFPKERGKIKISYEHKTTGRADYALSPVRSRDLVCLLNILEFGPVTWFDTQKTKVKTSYNVGPLTVQHDGGTAATGNVSFHVVSRSSDELQQTIFTKRIHNYFNYFLDINPASAEFNDIKNDVWESSANNKMANFIYKIKKDFKYQPVMADIHAWAEMSQFPAIIQKSLGKDAYMASIGCTITGVHSRQETFYVATMDSLFKTLVYALMNIERM